MKIEYFMTREGLRERRSVWEAYRVQGPDCAAEMCALQEGLSPCLHNRSRSTPVVIYPHCCCGSSCNARVEYGLGVELRCEEDTSSLWKSFCGEMALQPC